jgi:hypothetical protein
VSTNKSQTPIRHIYRSSGTYDTIYQLDDMRMTDCLENIDFAFQILKQLRRQLLSSYSLDCYRSAGGLK